LFNPEHLIILARVQATFPTLRLTQLKDMLFKEFEKSPENPMNKKK
jgi:hypothetical protein